MMEQHRIPPSQEVLEYEASIDYDVERMAAQAFGPPKGSQFDELLGPVSWAFLLGLAVLGVIIWSQS